ncbi:hypothetical protein [Saccharicrinis sp. GN24d3]|uniref:hypothetical protein n=1 Tax=Saccharicrinis sp. GN24d3 TaxID=3458416 RepID=UPI00403594CF
MDKKYYRYKNGFWGELECGLILFLYAAFWIILAEIAGLFITRFFLTINILLVLKINGLIVGMILLLIIIKGLLGVKYYQVLETSLIVRYNFGKTKTIDWKQVVKIGYFIDKGINDYKVYTQDKLIKISHIPFEVIEKIALNNDLRISEDF